MQARQHRSALDLDGLDDEDEHERDDQQREDEVAQQQPRLGPEVLARLVAEAPHLDVAVVVTAMSPNGGSSRRLRPNMSISTDSMRPPLPRMRLATPDPIFEVSRARASFVNATISCQ